MRVNRFPCHYGWVIVLSGALTLFFAVGQVFGPGAAGLLAEACGTFTASFLLCGLLTGSAAFLAMRLPGVDANGGEGGR